MVTPVERQKSDRGSSDTSEVRMGDASMKSPEEIAAQLWCLPRHSHKTMDVEFASDIAAAIRVEREESDRLRGILDTIAGALVDAGNVVVHEGISMAQRIRELTAERDRLRREWDAVVMALGPHAHPGLSPSENVAEVVAKCDRLRGICREALELIEAHAP